MLEFLAFICILCGVVARNSYVIILPSTIRPGMSLNIGVNILRSSGDVVITGTLRTSRVSTSSSIRARPGEKTSLTLEVPLDFRPGFYDIWMHGALGLNFFESRRIRVTKKSLSVFIQTDKGIYKPGQTVHLRTFAVFPDLKPLTGAFDIKIFDPKNNEIKQWLQARDDSNVIARDFTISDEPMKGKWKVSSEANGQKMERFFDVEEFVLPKFEVKIGLPSFGLTRDVELSGTIEAKYTFGKSVEGTVNLRIRKNLAWSPFKICPEPLVELAPFKLNGKTSFKVPMSQLIHLESCGSRKVSNSIAKLRNMLSIRVEANVTESLTGNRRNGSNTMKYYDKEFKLEWLSTNSKNFKPGLWYNALLKVTTQDSRPLPVGGRTKFVTIKMTTSASKCQFRFNFPRRFTNRNPTSPSPTIRMVLPPDGIINWANIIPKDTDTLTLTAQFPGASPATTIVNKMDSPSNSYIQANLLTGGVRVGEEATFEILCTSPMDKVVYQIFSRGNMVSMVELEGRNRTEMFVFVNMTTQMAPNARFVVHKVQPDGEILVDVVSFTVKGIFENDVFIELDRASAEPGEDINIVVNADANSTVNLLAVDQSVLLLKSGNDITPAEVEREITSFDERPTLTRNRRWQFLNYPLSYDGTSVFDLLENAGIVVITDATIHRARICRIYPVIPIHAGLFGGGGGGGGGVRPRAQLFPGKIRSIAQPSVAIPAAPGPELHPELDSPEEEPSRLRELFPDTWLWTNKTAGAEGRATFTVTVPDTITSWITSAFAMNPVSGLGVSQSTSKLEVFIPFFVSLDLPFSVVRGEEVVLQAIVFNYLDVDTEVDVTLARSDSFDNILAVTDSFITTSADQVRKIQVNAGQAKSVFFPVVPAHIGNIDISVTARSPVAGDALIRQLRVVAEGVPQEYSVSFLIDLTETNQYNNTVELPFPEDVVDGTKRLNINALGDIMAPTINNLDRLLKMPSGCGEQNMLKFAPDVFILKYLSSKNQLTDAIRIKAINFLETGYAKELTFQHTDGSFSAFGDRDKSGSMWLSSFVLMSFTKAKPFIFIDDKILRRTTSWIIRRQSRDGSFPEPGRVIHSSMQGGSGSGTALTAYVLIALLKRGSISDSQQNSVQAAISKAQTFLESRLANMSDTYSLAISTYALTLTGSASATSALDRLDRRAIVQGGLKHWDVADPLPVRSRHWRPPNRARAGDIEVTAYVLLIHAHNNNLIESLKIAKWLVGQRNANGGFASTQDTVLALEALSELPSLDSSPILDVNIVVSAPAFSHSFAVSRSNALFVQAIDLELIPSAITIEANGTGVALLQISLSYNVHRDSQEPSFDIRSRITNETVNDFILETCARYLKSDMSGMVVQETGIPAGFEADVESITKFTGLKRIETLDRKVVLYFDAVSSIPVCVTMKVVRSGLVAKSQPVAIQIYRYYSPEDQVTVFYKSELLASSSFCDICADCACPSERKK